MHGSHAQGQGNGASKPVASRFRTLRLSKRVLAMVIIVIAVAGFFVSAYAFNLFGSKTNCWVQPIGSAGTAIFTVVMADKGRNVGYNGSEFHAIPWPVMNVTVNQSVIIHVINNDTQAHGFTITHYYDQGIGGNTGLGPGKCFDVRFIANQTGSFIIFCDILCTIHQFMQHAELNVNP